MRESDPTRLLSTVSLCHQLEKVKPLINLVDNMVKLGSLYPLEKKLRQNAKAQQQQQQQQQQFQQFHQVQQQQQQHSAANGDPPMYSNVHQWRTPATEMSSTSSWTGSALFGWEEAQIAQLEAKHKQLGRLEGLVRDEGGAIQRLTQKQNVLRTAIRSVRQQTNTALQNADYAEVDHCRRQQLFLERELSQVGLPLWPSGLLVSTLATPRPSSLGNERRPIHRRFSSRSRPTTACRKTPSQIGFRYRDRNAIP